MTVEQTVAITIVIVGILILACNHSWITVTNEVRDKTYLLTKGILLLYLTDLFLLLGFNIPISLLHDCSPAGIVVNILTILIIIMNLACDYAGVQLEINIESGENYRIHYLFGFSVSVLWLYIEITGVLFRISP